MKLGQNEGVVYMEPAVFHLFDAFHRLLFTDEQGVEPLLIADHEPGKRPQRLFLVRYIVGEGGSAESQRPIFKDELTGYDYRAKETYGTQRIHLDALQFNLESLMYGSSDAQLTKIIAENLSTREQRPIKAIVSESLVDKLVALYGFGW